MALNDVLPDPLPADPLRIAADWLADAYRRAEQPNPNSMVLATCDAGGQPSARVVLCKEIVADPGYVHFVSNYHSRKGRELEANPRAALVLHWDHSHRQLRMEGLVLRNSPAQSDRYFAQRARQSQLGAHASQQSEPIASRAALIEKLDAVTRRFGAAEGSAPIPRPDHWGGYQLWVSAVELWVEGDARIHDRARWSRRIEVGPSGAVSTSAWQATRLQP